MTTPMKLGRFKNHDPRSKGYPARVASIRPKLNSVSHSFGPHLDQGQVGSCVANTATEHLNSLTGKQLDEAYAVQLYRETTKVDPFPGSWEPDDTGTDHLSAARVLKQRGEISSYWHAFGLVHMLAALQQTTVMVGTDWTEGMFTPNRYGTVKPYGAVQGGHEYLAIGYVHQYWSTATGKPVGWVWFLNHWGTDWGVNGTFRMSTKDVDYLLQSGGDCMVLQP